MHVWVLECAARASLKIQDAKMTQKTPSGHHRTTLSGYIFPTKARIVLTIGKKLVKQQYLLHMTLQYGELQPTSGWDCFVSLGRLSKFQRVSRLGFVTAATSLNGSQPNFARCLAVFCAATLYIHFWRLSPRNGILPGAKFSLRPPSLALFYWQRYYTALEQWARAKRCGIKHRAPPIFGRATITLGIGPHSSYIVFTALY